LQAHHPRQVGTVRELAIAWINRGNALQKIPDPNNIAEAFTAYDRAITLFDLPDHRADEASRDSLGAAWLNRSHALQQLKDNCAATASIKQAVSLLHTFPCGTVLDYRLKLAGPG